MLTTARLHLRELRQEDRPIIAAYWADPRVSEYQLRQQAHPAFVEQWVTFAVSQTQSDTRQAYVLGITQRDDPALIGTCTLFIAPANSRHASIGWELNPCFWGRGYATEAASALVDYAFRDLKLQRVIGNCFAANAASMRIMTKLNMQRNRNPLTTWLMVKGYHEKRPIVYYFINKADW